MARAARSFLGRALLVFTLMAAEAGAQNPPPLPTNPPANEEMVEIKLPDADIDTVLSALEIYTGRVATLRPAALPPGTYNLVFNKPVAKSEAILAIETALALNQIAVIPLGDKFLKVVPLNISRAETPEMIVGSTLDRAATGRVASKVFQLEFLRVGEFAPLLGNILNVNYGGAIQLPNANALLVTDSISNLQRVERLIQELDRPIAAGMKPKFYQLHEANASDVVTRLRSILTGTLQVQLGQATTYNADDRTNQIILVTDPRQYPFFDDLISKLDVRADPNTKNEVIYLNHAKAADVATVVSRIISQQTAVTRTQTPNRPNQGQQGPQPLPGAPNQPQAPQVPTLPGGLSAESLGVNTNEFSKIVTVTNDERSNSVVVSGTLTDVQLIKDLIAKLDIVLAQVRIEVVIAEVSIEDNNESGFKALGLILDGDKLVGFSGATENVVISNGTITRPGTSGGYDLAATIAIGTTPRKGNGHIISRPAVVTSHGKPGKIFYGETRPVITGTTTIPGATNNLTTTSSQVTQQEIGTTLTVTPFIGQDGSVQLDLQQDVNDVTGNVIVDGNTQYIIGKRNSQSYVSAKSGDILVFGGFEKHSNTDTTSRLGPIPFIGDFFGSRAKNKKRQELIFFLRPTVLTNNPSVDNVEALKELEHFPQAPKDLTKEQLEPKRKS